MTFVDATPSPSGTWSESTSTTLTWNSSSDPSGTWNASTSTTLTWNGATQTTSNMTLGNFSRMIDADPLADGSGGVDFNVTATTENPAIITTTAPVVSTNTNRNDP